MNWDNHRRALVGIPLRDAPIDLVDAFDEAAQDEGLTETGFTAARDFLREVEFLQPIVSRQAAAVAIAQALRIAREEG